MAVVSMADGRKLGTIEDVLVDTGAWRVAAFVLEGPHGKAFLPFKGVRTFGRDAVTVEDAAATQGLPGQPEGLLGLRDLRKLKVVNGEGTYLGDVQDLRFGERDGSLEELVAHKGGILGLGGASTPIPVTAIRGTGPEVLTADLPATK
jgi:sporulation protein YlmC with PRC-barrel domain